MKFIKGVKSLTKYDIYLIDQWGVIHNGIKKFTKAYKVLLFLKKIGKKLIIISNSSENSLSTIKNTLNKLKIDKNLFYKIVTGGEIFEKEIKKIKLKFKKKKLKCYCISEFNKKEILLKQNIFIAKKNEKIDFILASSIKPNSNIKRLKNELNYFLDKNIPMICTNPDKIVFSGKINKLVYQVGILAEYYKQNGGRVKFYGKPYPKIFQECLTQEKKVSKKRVLMIGDSLQNDILGGQNFNIDTLFILNGNHKNEFLKLEDNEIKSIIKNKWKKINPTYILDQLKL